MLYIESLQNARVKEVVKLRTRAARDAQGVLLIEGYREILRSQENNWPSSTVFFCRSLFLGCNEMELLERCEKNGAQLIECAENVFRKIAYRDRPDGLLALAPQIRRSLDDLQLPENPLILVAESIEKPGNLGTMLRSSDAAGVDAVIVCDKCTDINNPNVVRASVGTLFTVQVAEASTTETIEWLRRRSITSLAATPSATDLCYDVDMKGGVAIVVGSEQYGLHEEWMNGADRKVLIPMRGRADSLNVAAAATILLFEAQRQRLL
ncbi:MAG: RNA methyltransferase [Spartobacteria bacterium]|nr:RNA methyltransferase [Spartobacteria bacterium]